MKTKRTNILSIDGGGIRVLMPLIVLMELEERTTRTVASMFHMVGGTSFGGLVAAALNQHKGSTEQNKPKHNTLDVFNLIKDNRDKIFKLNPAILDPKTGRPSPAKCKFTGEPMYQSDPLNRLLQEHFLGAKMYELINMLSIPCFNKSSCTTLWFENDVSEDTTDWLVSDVVMSSMRAPTFFEGL